MRELISVIVPVYNSQRYIRNCVASVLEQTYPYFELLLIDDGSRDNSRNICRELCAQDERLSLITCGHRGVSAARNTGIEAAKGTYLFFLDSDDIIHPQLLEFLYRLMKEKKAAVGTERLERAADESFHKPGEWRMEDPDSIESSRLGNEEALDCSVFASSWTSLSGIGGKMIQKSALGAVRFHEKLTHGEDTLFVYQLLEKGADVVVLCRNWYCYRKHGGGTIDRLSVEGCGSIYRVERYIRDREIEKGRIKNAALWENAILAAVISWYEAGQRAHDDTLMRYAKSRAEREKKHGIFPEVRRIRRWEISFLIYYHPFRHVSYLRPLLRLLYCLDSLFYRCHRKLLDLIHVHRWKLLNLIHIYRRKLLDLIHIHRWRVRWVYQNVRWKLVWADQKLRLIIRRVYWKMIVAYRMFLKWKEHFHGKEKG